MSAPSALANARRCRPHSDRRREPASTNQTPTLQAFMTEYVEVVLLDRTLPRPSAVRSHRPRRLGVDQRPCPSPTPNPGAFAYSKPRATMQTCERTRTTELISDTTLTDCTPSHQDRGTCSQLASHSTQEGPPIKLSCSGIWALLSKSKSPSTWCNPHAATGHSLSRRRLMLLFFAPSRAWRRPYRSFVK